MADINKIVEEINLPKQILDKTEKLFKTLFGPSIVEIGGTMADSVRLRRFKNQIRIFGKAQKILEKKKIDPSKISLKVLAPLLEYSSYEEDKSLQEKWVNLTVNILSNNIEHHLQQNFIRLLNLLSSQEAKILDHLFRELRTRQKIKFQENIRKNKKRKQLREKQLEFRDVSRRYAITNAYSLDNHVFKISDVSKDLNISADELRLYIANLVSIGVLKWKINLDITSKIIEDETVFEIEHSDIEIYEYGGFIFTPVGIRLVETCKA